MAAYVTAETMQNKLTEWLRAIESYNRHPFELKPNRAVLLVVDMQNDFLLDDGSLFTEGGKAAVPNIKKMVTACRQAKIPVIYTVHAHEDPARDGGMTAVWWPELGDKTALVKGTRGAEIYSELAPLPGEKIIYKHRYSAFYNTDLEIVLRGLKVEDLIIAGLMTNICCESTARDAFFRDFRIFFLADGTGSVAEELHVATLRALAYAFAYVTTVEEMLKQIGRNTKGSTGRPD